MKFSSTITISEDMDLSPFSTTELHSPEPVHKPRTKQNKPDMHHKGVTHDHLCIYIVLN